MHFNSIHKQPNDLERNLQEHFFPLPAIMKTVLATTYTQSEQVTASLTETNAVFNVGNQGYQESKGEFM